MISLSPWALFLQAGVVGKCVMALLLALSVYSWMLIAEGAIMHRRLRRACAEALGKGAPALLEEIEQCGSASSARLLLGETAGERRTRIEEAMLRPGRRLMERAEAGLTGLAITASATPFIGLFGTVWGIVTSFAGIAQAQDTSLAVVAPGIAEALAATAFGLAAAIPASVGYNRLGAALHTCGGRLADFISERALAHAEAPRS